MKIKQDPITKLWCREDGAVLMPPTKHSDFKKFRWTFGTATSDGYRIVGYYGKAYKVHRIIARAFLSNPGNLPTVDHIDRCPSNNKVGNLRWASYKMQNENHGTALNRVDYGVRECEDPKAYHAARAAKMKAQGLSYRKGSDGKWGWFPRIRA